MHKASWRTPALHTPSWHRGEAEPLAFSPPSWSGKDVSSELIAADLRPEGSLWILQGLMG